jgi:hypothetical protein
MLSMASTMVPAAHPIDALRASDRLPVDDDYRDPGMGASDR